MPTKNCHRKEYDIPIYPDDLGCEMFHVSAEDEVFDLLSPWTKDYILTDIFSILC